MIFLTLYTYHSKGGIETFNQYFVQALIKNGISFQSISLHDKENNLQNHHRASQGSIFRLIKNIFLHLKYHDTIVWGHINLLPLFLILYPFLKNKRNILIIHGVDVWNPLYKNLPKTWAVKKINEVWSVSNYTKKRFVENYNFPFEKIHIFPNTILFKNNNNPNPYTKNSINILSILRLQNRDKILSALRIIEVLPELLKKYAIHFYIIGDGVFKNQLIQHVNSKRLEKYVHILGHVDNTAPYLEHCDIFTLVSDTEGFGIVLLEAMQFAKPCIAALNTGSEDVILNGESGFLINPDNSYELFTKLSMLIEDNNLRTQMGKKGYAILENSFTFEHFCEKQKQLLLF